jgi:aldehyde:ferredoxin oxidoreductase
VAEYGYAGEILKIDLSTGNISKIVTIEYADRFFGGRGIAAKLYWDLTVPETRAFDPGNCLSFITGPVTGFTRFAASRTQVCGKSPEMDPEAFSYANLGGSWGSWLKYAGYDGIVLTGMAVRPIYLYIDDEGRVEIRDATYLWGKNTMDTRQMLEAELGSMAKIVAIGPAAENLVYFATAAATQNSNFGGGLASVMGSKKLKAIAIRVNGKKYPLTAQPEALQNLAKKVLTLNTLNWEDMRQKLIGKKSACYGCISGCSRRNYEAEDSRIYRSFCQGTLVYKAALKENVEVSYLATRFCDLYGLDTMVLEPLITWLDLCYQAGILSESETGLPLSQIARGSKKFIETLVKKLSYREGFGDILAQGTLKAAKYVGKGSEKLLGQAHVAHKTSEVGEYDPRLILPHALIYATEPQKAIQLVHSISHSLRRWVNWLNGLEGSLLSTEIFAEIAEEYWGSKAAADFSTFEGKALAAKMIQDYGYIKESLILCDMTWPIHQVREIDHSIGLCTLESRIASAITGRNLDEKELMKIGERIVNLQRMLLLRDGWGGRKGDTILDHFHEEPLQGVYWSANCIVPGKNGEVISKKGAILERNGFEKMKDEYYSLRGWDVESGYPTKIKLEELTLSDLCLDAEDHGLFK